MSNSLATETSPYLLQHKDNPVHWRPWGDDALAEAKRLDKPILLSIGYAACHWCHVMAHESFEDSRIASLMNDLFISIKVDREERPDVDAIYQAALAIMGEQGGWPLTLFLTPAGEPFWGGTYFPPTPRWGRPGFPEVLAQVAQAHYAQKEKIAQNVDALRHRLAKLGAPDPGKGLSATAFDEAAAIALRLLDPILGGTAGAPKFPQPVFFRLLWRAHCRTGASMFREAVVLTLDQLCRGGIYDHLGGGFARYSTDERWLVPHFEKMLYDNAQLVDLMTEVWAGTRSPLYAARIAETIEWANREMRIDHPSGDGTFAFASALDADSEGVEGKYYVWSEGEIDRLLGSAAPAFKRLYDVTPNGNWEGHTILNLSRTPDLEAALADPAIAAVRRILRDTRDARVRPGRDEKVLADWNGLMIAALARASRVFDRPEWLNAARSAFDFVARHMHVDGRLRHVWCVRLSRHPAVLEDYANLARAALMLFEATNDSAYLQHARDWVATVDRHYWDGAGGGYFMSADDTTDVLVRTKSINDNAVPSGNGTMVEVLARLWLLTGEASYRERADTLLQLFSGDNPQYLMTVPGFLVGAELLVRAVQVIVAGPPVDPGTTALRRAVWASPAPLAVLSTVAPDQPLPPSHPAFDKSMVNNRPGAYVCVGQTCSPPLTNPDELRQALAAT